MACALIANAASFVLPISNPANLVVFGAHMPALFDWIARFALPSAFAIGATYAVLRWYFARELAAAVDAAIDVPVLSPTGRLAALAIALTALVLLAASAFGLDLGAPTLATAALATLAIAIAKREAPWPALRDVSWSVLLLVAGLFVIVGALAKAGALALLTDLMRSAVDGSELGASASVAAVVALACNLMNNLPAGLIAGSVVATASVSPLIQNTLAIAIDLGPNLSVTGSLATILWLLAIRRGGEQVSAWAFFKLGAVAMPVALAAAIGALWLQRWALG
jgi:arsenical pump membrane protein